MKDIYIILYFRIYISLFRRMYPKHTMFHVRPHTYLQNITHSFTIYSHSIAQGGNGHYLSLEEAENHHQEVVYHRIEHKIEPLLH